MALLKLIALDVVSSVSVSVLLLPVPRGDFLLIEKFTTRRQAMKVQNAQQEEQQLLRDLDDGLCVMGSTC